MLSLRIKFLTDSPHRHDKRPGPMPMERRGKRKWRTATVERQDGARITF